MLASCEDADFQLGHDAASQTPRYLFSVCSQVDDCLHHLCDVFITSAMCLLCRNNVMR
jgi:hypothetical protein